MNIVYTHRVDYEVVENVNKLSTAVELFKENNNTSYVSSVNSNNKC